MASPPPPATSPGRTPTPTASPPPNLTSSSTIYAPPIGSPPPPPLSMMTTTAPTTTPAPAHATPQITDPKVAELQIMFPTVDPTVIELILESSAGSQDRAIEQLLSMTDENFKPDELESVRREEDSQVDLDAEFARSLQFQEEEDMRRAGQRQQSPRGGGELPYQPRVRRSRPQAHQGGEGDPFSYGSSERQGESGGNPPGMIALEEKLGQYAEVGKQTFTSLLSKAKARYADFQTQQAVNRDAGQRDTSWSKANQGASWRRPSDEREPAGGRGGEQNRGMWGDSASFSNSSRSASISSQSTIDPGPMPISTLAAQTAPLRQSPSRWQPTDAYADPFPVNRSTPTQGGASNLIEIHGEGRRSPGVGFAGSPDKPGTGKIDPAKLNNLGLLPKKKVLLGQSPTSSSTAIQTPPKKSLIDDDDENANDPNPALPSAPRDLVAKIPPTPPVASPYRLEDSDDELEYTK
ncbi:hypothetical protein BCR39DRAFT_546669 [Naematelia encephala]|uniref:CUE domain-containing protein n=1 Tax=Naematelia encephala TaxID=71784 RepID=A0A1Y2APQ2_9TREE|nr:hypothetical protein BCR39DRAFT_546669 [Naematelia encephala]